MCIFYLCGIFLENLIINFRYCYWNFRNLSLILLFCISNMRTALINLIWTSNNNLTRWKFPDNYWQYLWNVFPLMRYNHSIWNMVGSITFVHANIFQMQTWIPNFNIVFVIWMPLMVGKFFDFTAGDAVNSRNRNLSPLRNNMFIVIWKDANMFQISCHFSLFNIYLRPFFMISNHIWILYAFHQLQPFQHFTDVWSQFQILMVLFFSSDFFTSLL